MNLTRRVPVTMPAKRMEGMRMDEFQYDKLVRFSRIDPDPKGVTFREDLAKAMNSSVYLDATPDARVDIIKEIQESHDANARDRLYEEDLDFQIKLDAFQDKRDALKFGTP